MSPIQKKYDIEKRRTKDNKFYYDTGNPVQMIYNEKTEINGLKSDS